MRNTKITTGDLKDGAAMPRPEFSSKYQMEKVHITPSKFGLCPNNPPN